jgi:excisionase family DNA binding protein
LLAVDREVLLMQNQNLLFTIPESAVSLRISRSTLYRLIASGDIETITVRGLQRIRPIALQRFVENQQRVQRERVVNFS